MAESTISSPAFMIGKAKITPLEPIVPEVAVPETPPNDIEYNSIERSQHSNDTLKFTKKTRFYINDKRSNVSEEDRW